MLSAGVSAHRHRHGGQRHPDRRRHGYHRYHRRRDEPGRDGRGGLADQAPCQYEQRVGRHHRGGARRAVSRRRPGLGPAPRPIATPTVAATALTKSATALAATTFRAAANATTTPTLATVTTSPTATAKPSTTESTTALATNALTTAA